jgi:hypothetical protein
VVLNTTSVEIWSWRCWPTPGRSRSTFTPAAFSTSAGPMPDSMSICGEPIAPPERMTSLRTVTVVPPRRARGCGELDSRRGQVRSGTGGEKDARDGRVREDG